MIKTVAIVILVLCSPVFSLFVVSLALYLLTFNSFLKLLCVHDAGAIVWPVALGILSIIGYVSLWRFVGRLSPQFQPQSMAEADSIAKGVACGILSLIPTTGLCCSLVCSVSIVLVILMGLLFSLELYALVQTGRALRKFPSQN